MRSRHFLLVASSLILGACASAPTNASTGGGSSNYNQVTAEQIATTNLSTAYDVIDRLRRKWWQDLSLGPTPPAVVVYMSDNQKLGDRETLKQIPASDVALLQYIKSTDAIMKFGQDASGGAIIVTRK